MSEPRFVTHSETAGVPVIATVSLTSTQIKALKATPVQILPVATSGMIYASFTVVAQYKFGTVPYTIPAGATLYVSAGPQDTAANLQYIFFGQAAANFLDQSHNMVAQQSVQASPSLQSDYSGPVIVCQATDAVGELSAGDGTLTITMYYTLVAT